MWAGIFSVSILPSCVDSGSGASLVPPPILKTPPKPFKVAVLRLHDSAELPEPTDRDIIDGFKAEGFTPGKYFELVTYDAAGDRDKIPGKVQAALDSGADLLLAVTPETARVAASKAGKNPVVFAMHVDPFAMGLGKTLEDHQKNVTGAFTRFEYTLWFRAAREILPKAKRYGMLFNPDDPESVAHKDALLRTDTQVPEVKAMEFHSESELPEALAHLMAEKPDAIFLLNGLGRGSTLVIDEAAKARVPVFGFTEDQVKSGALMGRVPDVRWGGFEAGRRAARILAGAEPDRVPIVEGSSYQTVINMRVSKQFGIPIPAVMLRDGKIAVPSDR
jgi:putative ABC transport system substrate-binding protein